MQSVDDRVGAIAGHSPYRRRETVDVVGIDDVRLDVIQDLSQRAKDRWVPQIDSVPARPNQAVWVPVLFVESPIQVQGSDAPDSNSFPFIRPIPPVGKLVPPARGDYIDVVAQAVQCQCQLGSNLLRPADGERRKQGRYDRDSHAVLKAILSCRDDRGTAA